jgi:hypothetical protein
MKINEPARSGHISLASSAISRAGRLLLFGLIGWLWFLSETDSATRAVSIAAILALAALGGLMWYQFRARADSRLQAALDANAKREQSQEED